MNKLNSPQRQNNIIYKRSSLKNNPSPSKNIRFSSRNMERFSPKNNIAQEKPKENPRSKKTKDLKNFDKAVFIAIGLIVFNVIIIMVFNLRKKGSLISSGLIFLVYILSLIILSRFEKSKLKNSGKV